MSRAFFGNMMIALRTSISATTLTAVGNATTSSITATVLGGRGVYTYLWIKSGTNCTINSSTSVTTTFTGSGVAGTTTVYCQPTDTITGNTLNTSSCTITWTAVPVSQNVAISGFVTYNTLAQSYTLTGTPATPAPTGNPPQFINAATYVYPTNITSITPGSGYTLGTVTGSFVINRALITAMSFSLNSVGFTSRQYRSAGASYTIAVSGTTPSVATKSPVSRTESTANNYTLTSVGTGNYQGSFTSQILSLISASITQNSPRTPSVVPLSAVLSQTPPGVTYLWARVSGTACSFSSASLVNTNCTGSGNLQSVIRCTIAYTGSTTTPSTNLVPQSTIQWGIA
jgi:hypothetical protein